jgi:hypothetical protein
MRATALLFVLAAALAGATACKGDGKAAAMAVVPGAPAGDVTELAGDVRATRDGKTRPLAKGDVVSGDDVIATGADGRVTIVLRHNQVAWALGPGRQKRVGDSAAWAAAKGAAAEEVTDDKSAAAGRHAERNGADTAASTGAAGGGSAVASGSGSAAASGSGGGGPGGGGADQQLADAKAEQERRDAEQRLAELAKLQQEQEQQRREPERTAKGKSDWKPKRIGSCDPNDPLCGVDDYTTASNDHDTDVRGAADTSSIPKTMAAHAAAFRACYQKLLKTNATAAGKIAIDMTLAASGKPTKVDVTGDDALAPMRDCVKTVVQGITFPAQSDETNVTYPMTFQPQ